MTKHEAIRTARNKAQKEGRDFLVFVETDAMPLHMFAGETYKVCDESYFEANYRSCVLIEWCAS